MSRFLISGATGLIGQSLVKRLIYEDNDVIAVVRNENKAKQLLGDNRRIEYIISDVMTTPVKEYEIDYIIHAAANTSSREFVETPVDVAQTSLMGTIRLLEIARKNHIKGFAYLSSMEVYGTPDTDEKIDEMHYTNLNSMFVRSVYPESKRMCENLCSSYASQYGVPAKVIRLTQTFGPGVQYNDGRVFAEFARCAIEGRDIVLRTKGETKRSYLYTEDAVDAILAVLTKGTVGEAYNAANEETFCSIYEMAEMVARECADGRIRVLVDEEGSSSFGYAPVLHMNLDTRKLQKLGWSAKVGLKEMFCRTIRSMNANLRKN